jgi:hypothetical protein
LNSRFAAFFDIRNSTVHQALFVISTGRCGTQWLAQTLRSLGGETVEVAHEPLHSGYVPRKMLGTRDPAKLDHDAAHVILAHVARIDEILRSGPYIECGHPLWSTLPYLLRRFAGRVRVVHLVRHPVPTAWSWVAQQAYCPPLAAHLSMREPLSPFDPGVRFKSYRARWPGLSPYEKALFYWLEVNAFARRLEQRSDAPWLRIRCEELFSTATLKTLLAFAGIDARVKVHAPPATDDYPCVIGSWSDPALIARHPDVIELATALGYDPMDFDAAKLRRRYLGSNAAG